MTELVAIPQNEMNIRQGPGIDYPVIGSVAAGESFNITGRNENASWVQVSSEVVPEGWLFADLVEVSEDVTLAPVIDVAPPLPTPIPPIEAVVQPETTGPATILFTNEPFPDSTDTNGGFYTINPDGTNLTQINSIVPNGPIELSPDGQKIAFTVQQWLVGGLLGTYSDHDPYVMNIDGTGLINLADSPDFNAGGSKWSPDGQRLAYNQRKHDLTRGLLGPNSFTDIYIVDADGNNKINVTNSPPGQIISSHQWSPDGQQFVVTTGSILENGGNGPSDVQVMNVDGSNRVNLTADLDDGNSSHPQWSTDGQQITFIHNKSGELGETMRIDSDGSNLTHLGDFPGYSDCAPIHQFGQPCQLPNRQIAIVQGALSLNGQAGSPARVLYLDNLDDGATTSLTQITPEGMTVSAWSISPDGQTIAVAIAPYHSPLSFGKYALYTMNVDGNQLTQLTEHEFESIQYVGWVPQ